MALTHLPRLNLKQDVYVINAETRTILKTFTIPSTFREGDELPKCITSYAEKMGSQDPKPCIVIAFPKFYY